MLSSAGHQVAVEQRDPSMGPRARLDIVEFPSDMGTAAAYDVSVVTPLRDDAAFREGCAAEPGLAAELRHAYKLDTQYGRRLPGARLFPLVAEIGGRWHPSVPKLVKRLAKECADRSSGLRGGHLASAICARWGARLSALIVRGNAAVHRLAQPAEVMEHRLWCEGAPALSHLLPHGSCLYEVLCMRQPGFAGEEEDAGCGDARAAGGEWEDTRGARGLARGTWEGAGDARELAWGGWGGARGARGDEF